MAGRDKALASAPAAHLYTHTHGVLETTQMLLFPELFFFFVSLVSCIGYVYIFSDESFPEPGFSRLKDECVTWVHVASVLQNPCILPRKFHSSAQRLIGGCLAHS